MRTWGVCAIAAAWLVAGCSSSSPAVHPSPPASLTVHVAVFGGPALPNGHMAVSNAPQRNVVVVATSSRSGRRWTGFTDTAGNANLSLPAGRYLVRGSCPMAKPITLAPGQRAVLQLPCDVP